MTAISNEADDWNANRPVSRIFHNIMMISRFYNDVIDETASNFGLASGEFMVLMTLMRLDNAQGVRSTTLYGELLVTSGAVSKRIDKLVDLGLVERAADQSDGRAAFVRLTKKGRKIGDSVRSKRTRMYEVADRLGEKSINEMDEMLIKYLSVMQEINAEID